jgi:hypothetical protein
MQPKRKEQQFGTEKNKYAGHQNIYTNLINPPEHFEG